MSKISPMLTKISVLAAALLVSVVYSTGISPTIVHADAYNDCVASAVDSFLRTHGPNDMNVTVQQGIERTCRTQHPASAPNAPASAPNAPASAPNAPASAPNAPAQASSDNVGTTYINEEKVNARAAYRDPTRRDVLGFLDTLAQCLNTTNNWQTGGVTTVAQLKAQLRSNDAHPCADAYTPVITMRDQMASAPPTVVYPTLIRDYRLSGLNSTVGVQMRDNATWSEKFEAYFTCLMAETGGNPNWQTGTPPPTTIAQLATAVRDNNQHPCHQARADLEAVSRPQAADPANAPASNNAAPAPNTSSNTAATGVDNRPLYQRIVAPNSADVLTPAFVKDRNPSVAGLVNYLFDFFVRRLLPLLSGVLVIVIIWAGFQYIMAQGDSGKVKQAKDTILFSIIGLVIALASLTIVTILNNLLLATS